MNPKDLARERRQLRAEIDSALEGEDDPLAAYDQFVKWTIKNYAEGDPDSGLVELLEEATRKFKDDANYKGDLRYLKLWCQYARQVDKPASVYAFLIANDIGNGYALLYEEYAKALEAGGR
jgi:checkpoint serine/threonine-protein kinase